MNLSDEKTFLAWKAKQELHAGPEIINDATEWSTSLEKEYDLPQHPNVSIWLGGPMSGRYMMVSNDKAILDALAEQKWTFEIDSNSGGCRPKNADPSSIWQRAEDLVAYTLLKARKDTKGRLLVPSPEVYFNVVHVVQTGRKMHDLRSHVLHVRFRKFGKEKLELNRIANQKKLDSMKSDTWKEQVHKKMVAMDLQNSRPFEDHHPGVLNDMHIPLAMDPLANKEPRVASSSSSSR